LILVWSLSLAVPPAVHPAENEKGVGVRLQAGQPAPIPGILLTPRELAALLAKKDHAYKVLKVESESALKVCNIELKAVSEDATRWGKLSEIRGKENIALRVKYQGVINHVNRWRFGIGLLFIKSPENIRVE
jgi:hypothetical protein